MRILQINSAKNFGGGERHLIDLCRGLRFFGDEGKSRDSEDGDGDHEIFVAVRVNAEWTRRLSFLPERRVFRLPLKNSLDVFSARKLVKIIEENKIEIVHAHLARDYPMAALAARITNAKLVLTRHLLFPLNRLHKFVLPPDAIFIAVSEGVRRALVEQNILPPEQIRLIYNGVDARHFAEAENGSNERGVLRRLNLPENSRVVGIVGEISAHKGQTDFARAASIVLRRFPETEFLVVGRDNSPRQSCQKNLENLIDKLDLRAKIHFLGWTDDIAPVFSALDVFVSASRTEPFGLVIVEAMAAGCAVVATETDGAREIIEDGATGKLVPTENPAELARAVEEFLASENLRRDFGANARAFAAEKFSVEKMVEATEKLYREILAG